jgi:hypothetical protein
MLRKINSVKEIQQLVIGDTLLDDAEPEKAKPYIVRNITDGVIYAIHDSGFSDLKVFRTDGPPESDWWILS